MVLDDDTIAFLKEREEKLGGELIYRAYATWYGRNDGEEREYGVFLYSDGKTLVIEDFERTPTILGIRVKPRVKKEYIKLEHFLPLQSIKRIDKVTKSSADKSLSIHKDVAKNANLFDRIFRKTVIRVTLDDGTAYYFELPELKKLEKLMNN